MIAKIFITLLLLFAFVVECKSQDTLKVADSISQDIIIEDEPDTVIVTVVEGCKCDYVKTLPTNTPKFLYKKDIDIVVWSYEPTYHSRRITPEKDTIFSLHWIGGMITDGTFSYGNSEVPYTKGKESIKLSKEQKEQLFNLLHHYQVISEYCTREELMCYQPRHVILFYKGDKVIDFLEVCLECQKFRFSNPAFSELFGCQEKYDLLKTFFSQIGIKLYLDREGIKFSEIRKRK